MRGKRAIARAHSREEEKGRRMRPRSKILFDRFQSENEMLDTIWHNCIDQIRALAMIPLLGTVADPDPASQRGSGRTKIWPGDDQYNSKQANYEPFIGCFVDYLAGNSCLAPTKITRTPALHGITDSACKNQLVVVSVQYGPLNPYIPISSTTIGKSRVAKDPIAMHTSWRSNSDITSVTSTGYPCMSASGESSTTMHRLLPASGSHPIPPPDDPKFFPNNQQLLALNNSNDIVKDTSPLLPTADQKRYTQNVAFQLIKMTSPLISDWFLKPTAGHSAGTIPHNATVDSATIQQSTPKRLTNTCHFLVNPRTHATAASRHLFKRYY
ncbi:hypothetical protein F511_05875 [Dorcoceras hygrometricum]|uniref:Uncharacterized protein n=1 Tax=Dorcoceras hygrometricum TaxID=472368 RepID=A0A2Z7B623_9LAMI|nr:hypothetical protein F511_05875 [Dorcoceras hygrometricum]